MIDRIRWLGYGSFAITGTPLIYINPWRVVRETLQPDAILIGHDHYEHFSPADVHKVRGPDTQILSNEQVASQIEGCTVLRPWQSIRVGDARVTAVPAYSPDSVHHPQESGGLGFVVSLNLYDIYYAGDTQKIPEMALIKPDIAILPIDGVGTLTLTEAVDVVRMMRPRWVIPSNWGSNPEGASPVDAQLFKTMAEPYAQVILPALSR